MFAGKGHGSKLSLEEFKQTPPHTNYITHNGLKNVKKPGKMSVVFNVGAKFQSTSLNENLFKGPEL